MELTTILKRYTNLGYVVKGLDRDLEVDSIIKWIYDEFNIYIGVQYCDTKLNDLRSYKKFSAYSLWNVGEEYSNRSYSERNGWYSNPYDAKYHHICYFCRVLRFQFFGGKVKNQYKRFR